MELILQLIGGVGGRQILGMLTSGGTAVADAADAAATTGLDVGSIVSGLASGGAGGVILMLIVGLVKRAIAR